MFVLAATLLTACASAPKVPVDTGGEVPVIPEKDRARLEVDEAGGFTVTEVVRIDAEVRADYQDALLLLQQERYDAGIALLEEVVARAPGLTAPHIDLGMAYGEVKDYENAERSLKAALALAPDHPVALNELGIVYRKTGRFAEARQSYERALAVQPEFHYARRNLGVLCDVFLDDLRCALQQYRAYLEVVPDDQEVGMWVADLENRVGDNAEAANGP